MVVSTFKYINSILSQVLKSSEEIYVPVNLYNLFNYAINTGIREAANNTKDFTWFSVVPQKILFRFSTYSKLTIKTVEQSA